MSTSSTSSGGIKTTLYYPKLVNAKLLDYGIIVFSCLFFLQHPAIIPYINGNKSLISTTSYALEYTANITTAFRMGDTVMKNNYKNYWYEYIFHGETVANNNPKLQEFFNINNWKTSLILDYIYPSWLTSLPHSVAIYVRNFVAIHLVYYGFGAIWAYFVYVVYVDHNFPMDKITGKRKGMPSIEAIKAQMWVSEKAMPFYVLMPTMSEWFVERGWTRAVSTIEEMGGFTGYVVYTIAYLFFVEWAIYWIHRLLHEIRWLYKWLHYDHHIYNHLGDMSPFAGLAFHPFDGMAQASPYVIGLFLMPVHFWTHLIFLFFTGVWTTCIHDALKESTEPIMGSKYHMYHHTAYRDNYGQFFVFFDWIHDTLTDPLLRNPSHFGLVEDGAPQAAVAGTMFNETTETTKTVDTDAPVSGGRQRANSGKKNK